MLSLVLSAMMTQELQKPTPRQLAWHKMEYYGFVHFGPNTFTGKEWGEGTEKPEEFNPVKLDCRQWVQTFKKAGMKGVIVTAKHHDGFCLWPSKYSTHTVAQSKWRDGKGDVLKELAEACKKEGMKLGVYLSPWDRNHPSYGTPEYNKIFVKMLEEVLTNYGPIFEVWFDGANGEGPNGKKQVYDWPLFHSTVRRLQPNAVMFSDAGPDVRWVGNENGIAGDPCWATVNNSRYVPGTPLYKELTNGDPNGVDWVPAECDVSIRPGWFWRESENSKIKTPQQLMDIYLASVGRGATLLLNVPPNSDGLIAEEDRKALFGFKELRDKNLGVNLGSGGKWNSKTLQLVLSKPATINYVVLEEDIKHGQRIRQFAIDAWDGGTWKEIGISTSIGYRRILKVPQTETTKIRVRVMNSVGQVKLNKLRVY